MSTIKHVLPPDAKLSYEQLLHQTLAIVEDARATSFNLLTVDLPPAPTKRQKYFGIAPPAPEKQLELSPLVNEQVDIKIPLAVMREARVHGADSVFPVVELAEAREKLREVRRTLIERVQTAKDPTEGLQKSWPQRMRRAAHARVNSLLDYYDKSERLKDLLNRLNSARAVQEVEPQTRLALVERGDALRDYWYSRRLDWGNVTERYTHENVQIVIAQWKEMLWLAAEAQLWADEVRDALIAARLCKAYEEIKWAKMIFAGASSLAVEVHGSEYRFDRLLRHLRSLGASVHNWPENENAILVVDEEDETKLAEEVTADLNKPNAKQLGEIHVELSRAVDELLKDVPPFPHAATLNRAERERFTLKLDQLRKQHSPETTAELMGTLNDKTPWQDLRGIKQLQEIVVEWHSTMFESKYKLAPRTQQSEHTEASIGTGRFGDVPAAISARKARLYNI